ncbi:DUF1129 domain-containing protein (plasmid) [Latilactobacillus curvatus]|uniref:DUF1129 domain-containing protein n=1 Tax=Latilactobacillus curvatus TaxID=28038 RepID=A0AAJ5RH96_LATCU|nr:DUF1129 domain-containing protein [Latilactobacillus curvatus]EHE86355.1 hypothetical protein CRL705_519 [Latilactobacillus curvatus CRL 705]MCP8877900.1 DUF1129 domain-containing protein [Latilactobacillus curvatus]MCT3526317.1 DUF1129 domain-containing protein [Latilactobacillus curvatus]MDG2986983.1 DUF1129 domain-containing protein [Latilactobacillus curvatus]WDC92947.1 DUF1129 domain-containing protein [Latilactobacillus curvatus]
MAKNEQPVVTPEPVDIEGLEAKLSKKNADYLFKFKRALNAEQVPAERQTEILAEMLPEMVAEQHKGKPATQVYGPVATKVDQLLHAPKRPKQTSLQLQMLDNGLIFLIMYLAFNGIAAYFSTKGSATSIGITSIVITAALAGVIMTYPMRYTQMPKEQRPPFWKMALVVIGLTLAFVAAYGVTILIPSFLNPVLPPLVQIVIAALLIGVRIYIKRRFKITGSFFG